MKAPFPIIVAALLAAGPLTAQQAMVCPAPSGRTCELFHYHVQLYRPDTKQYVEISATPQFATQAACDRARDARAAANAKVVEYFVTTKQQQYGADRIGPCHCDTTIDKASPTYLSDAQRDMQLRLAEEVRLRVRERMLDQGLTTDSAVVRALDVDPPATPQLGGPRLVPLPQTGPAPVMTSPDDLRATKTIDTSKPSVAALDLPLVDIGTAAPPAVVEVHATNGVAETPAAPMPAATQPAATQPAVTPSAPAPQTSEQPAAPAEVPAQTPSPAPAPAVTETPVPAQPAPTEEEMLSAQETAENFISYETQRIQNVARAASSVADENIASRIFEACQQRGQLLSNLRLLIEGSGMRGALANAAREAQSESERLALIAKLFGEDIKPHWAPKDATDVVFDIDPEIAAAPDRVLRDTAGRYSKEQKRRALYLMLARTQPTEDQRLWLSTVIEGFLR